MDILKELPKIKGKMKNYNFMLGRITHFKLFEPSNAIRKGRHRGTDYYYFKCEVISKDMELIPYGRHTIQLPAKRVVFPLIKELEKVGKLKEEATITITRKSLSTFNICIHT